MVVHFAGRAAVGPALRVIESRRAAIQIFTDRNCVSGDVPAAGERILMAIPCSGCLFGGLSLEGDAGGFELVQQVLVIRVFTRACVTSAARRIVRDQRSSNLAIFSVRGIVSSRKRAIARALRW